MINIRIHINNGNDFFDPEVFIDIKLPAVPLKDDFLMLTGEQYSNLNNQITLKNAANYCSYIDYELGTDLFPDKIKSKHLGKDFFNRANMVSGIMYNADSDIVHIELYNPFVIDDN